MSFTILLSSGSNVHVQLLTYLCGTLDYIYTKNRLLSESVTPRLVGDVLIYVIIYLQLISVCVECC